MIAGVPLHNSTEEPAELGLGWCPACGCPESHVAWVRRRTLTHHDQVETKIFRARDCDHCGKRFTTCETEISGER